MRIIAGELGGRPLRSLPDDATRPAMARTREAIFSMLEARGLAYSSLHVLDLCAGSGSLAFEALSRGAETATLVDNAEACARLLARNAAALGLERRARIMRMDAGRFLRKEAPTPFGLVFIDPPYRRGMVDKTLRALDGWLAPNAFVAAEIEKGLSPLAPEYLNLAATRLFGQTEILIWQHGGDNDA